MAARAQKEAIAQLEESGRLAGDYPAVWSRLAEMYLATGQSELAWKNADRAIDIDPRLPSAWAVRGGVFRANGQFGEALTCYLRALGYAPKDRAILSEVATVYRQENQPERSLQTLQCLADTYPPGEEPAEVEGLLGEAYVALGRYDEAVESLSLALKRGTPTAEMFCRLGEAQFLAGRSLEAAATAQQALALDPRHPPSLALLQRIQIAKRSQETITR